MKQVIARRDWLKQTSLALAASTGFIPSLFNGESRTPPPAGPIRLHANENPYGPSPQARAAMAAAITASNRYPWDQTTVLREKIAARYGLTQDAVLMGAGSSELLGLIASFAALKPGNMVCATPTFNLWWTAAQQQGLQVAEVPLTAEKVHDLPAMVQQVNTNTRLVYVCNPNNPTGTIVDHAALTRFVTAASQQALVLVDEAYLEYTDEPSLAPLLLNNKRLIIVKTFSKIYGLAGARIGYALAHPELTQQLGRLQPWINAGPSAVSVAGAIASLEDSGFVSSSRQQNASARAFTEAALKKAGLPFIPSNVNFLYYSLQSDQGNFLQKLADHQIRVGKFVEEKARWARLTIGTQAEMVSFTQVLQQHFTT
ncbi:pyridoxal phosphate-dependent aminotransferase [Paraflavitalea pollutisoli]|uniref:pyridoxal phosphate-dependent aminotransferase n=1 Tax=Paraflavitalea pollutisoli TaxID=3034143 RepID=UPI0023EB3EBA|nr:histidinol-phosphate transaminase [Paraflavitalea sp. H1-2-19X]